MKKILDKSFFDYYVKKYHINNIFVDEILEIAQLHQYESGEYILRSDTELKYYYLLVEGKIKISYPFENGKSILLKSYGGFNSLGDLELFDNVPIRCDVEALENCYLIAVPAKILREDYMSNSKLLHHIISSLSDKLHGTINNSSYNLSYPLINRVSSYLVEQNKVDNIVTLNYSFQEIAQFFGTTYRHLNRTLKDLESKSIIKYKGKQIEILKEEELKKLSKNQYIKFL